MRGAKQIVVEGVSGAGKSTMAALVSEYLIAPILRL
jgi:thymidylate kinase